MSSMYMCNRDLFSKIYNGSDGIFFETAYRYLSPNAADLLQQMLKAGKDYRIVDIKTVKQHPFFHGFDWEEL